MTDKTNRTFVKSEKICIHAVSPTLKISPQFLLSSHQEAWCRSIRFISLVYGVFEWRAPAADHYQQAAHRGHLAMRRTNLFYSGNREEKRSFPQSSGRIIDDPYLQRSRVFYYCSLGGRQEREESIQKGTAAEEAAVHEPSHYTAVIIDISPG
jgi:hypothetical protein